MYMYVCINLYSTYAEHVCVYGYIYICIFERSSNKKLLKGGCMGDYMGEYISFRV